MKNNTVCSVILKNGKKLEVRRGLKRDLDAMWNIFNIVVRERKYIPVFNTLTTEFEKQRWYLQMREKQNLILVAMVDDKIIGLLTLEHLDWDASYHVGELGIVIHPEFRLMGIGFHLINCCIEMVKKEQIFKKITLSCFHNNIIALNLYKKLGFVKVGHKVKQYYINGEWIDEILLEKLINSTPPK
ncbi:MAG: GNAT family N-acetyltransferase [Candidatus Helarchaeota archaeon]